jgi:predicted component of type VI protein secretion system
MRVEKQHCYIKRVQEKYVLVNNGAPPEFTLVNERPVPQAVELQDGDRIQLGNVLLRFQLRRATAQRHKSRPLPPLTVDLPPAPPTGIMVPPSGVQRKR